jgi:hypothetical protein
MGNRRNVLDFKKRFTDGIATGKFEMPEDTRPPIRLVDFVLPENLEVDVRKCLANLPERHWQNLNQVDRKYLPYLESDQNTCLHMLALQKVVREIGKLQRDVPEGYHIYMSVLLSEPYCKSQVCSYLPCL